MLWLKRLIMGIWGLAIRIRRKLTLEVFNTFTQLITASVTAIALVLLVYQTFLQEETSNRSWAADRLAVIYSQNPQAPAYVRQEAVKAFVSLHRERGIRRLFFWMRREDQAVLSNADLSSLNFKGQDFSHVIFSTSAMVGTKFSGSNLSGTDLKLINAQGAAFVEANLSDSELSGASVAGADFSNAQLKGTVFGELDLGRLVCPGKTNAMNANFNGAKFDESTKLCCMNLSGANLAGAIGLTQKHINCHNTLDGRTTLPPDLRRP